MTRLLVPEVIQTSAMDCGPAALKALFGGFGIYLSYGRLREVCQTDVDGTSIDSLEDMAVALGMQAEQRMLPVDWLFLEAAAALPALVVVRRPDGAAHFVVLWRSHGSWVQLMDPAVGRVWMSRKQFLDSLFVHEQAVAASDWDEWSRSEPYARALSERMATLRVEPCIWSDRAHQDASLRLADALLEAKKLRKGADAEQFLALCRNNPAQIPPRFWSARPSEAEPSELRLRGAVLISAGGPGLASDELPEALAAVRNEPPPRVWTLLWKSAVAEEGRLPALLALCLVASALGTVLEALLFRSLLDSARHLELGGQRLAALAMVVAFLACLLLLRWPSSLGLLRLGRHLEIRLRARFLSKIPRLEDRYFQSRLISDMALRAHSVRSLRQLPALAGELVRLGSSLTITALAIAWLYPGSALLAVLAVVAACVPPVLLQPLLVERDLNFRELGGTLGRFSLDALLGARPIQAHAAGPNLRVAHSAQLVPWAAAGLRQQLLLAGAETLQLGLTIAPVIALVHGQAGELDNPSGLLLLVYWGCSIPLLGSQVASLAAGLPGMKNALLRLLEPLGADSTEPLDVPAAASTAAVSVSMERVSVVAGGHLLLDDVSVEIDGGEHIAVVGASGSGKSSLVGLLLGWYSPSQGGLSIDAAPLDPERLARLRRDTAWIDPQVHLFRTTLLDNWQYGARAEPTELASAFEQSELASVLTRLPRGLQTELGDGGALVSGGEGQRVRIARGFSRSHARLAVLDEASRGLDRESRARFLRNARERFAGATLFYVTHQIADALEFDRVLVMERGRIVEDGAPAELQKAGTSQFVRLLEAERAVRQTFGTGAAWRRLRLQSGRLQELGEG